jgi:hypothetical protein
MGGLNLILDCWLPVSAVSDQRPEGVEAPKRPDVECDTSVPRSMRIKARELRVAMRVLAYLLNLSLHSMDIVKETHILAIVRYLVKYHEYILRAEMAKSSPNEMIIERRISKPEAKIEHCHNGGEHTRLDGPRHEFVQCRRCMLVRGLTFGLVKL